MVDYGVMRSAPDEDEGGAAPGRVGVRRRNASLRPRRGPAQSETVTRFQTFIDSHPDGFERSCRVGHITGSTWIVNRTRDRVLLTHHRKVGRWLQPGGHSDGDPLV